MTPDNHEPVYVRIVAADGPVLVPHTREEYERLMDGVDMEAALVLGSPSERAR